MSAASSPRRRTIRLEDTGDLRIVAGRRSLVSGQTTSDSIAVLVLCGLLLLLGLVMTFSASFVAAAAATGDAFNVFARQAFWAGLGLPVAAAAALVDYRRWRPIAGAALLVTLAALIAVLIVGEEVNGARRWFQVGPVNIQPAEIVKLTLPLWCAHAIASRWGSVSRGHIGALLWPAGPAILLAAVLVAAGPDLESAALVGAIGATTLFVAGLPLRIVTPIVVGVAALGWWQVNAAAYRVGRFAAWLDPLAYADTFGYQTTQGFLALGSGGWFGVGLGQSRGKWLYIPNAHTDFIYAIVGEELGLFGAVLVLVAFAALAWLGVRVAMRSVDIYGRLLASAITGWLVLQAAINMSSVVGLLPVTGVTLPLVSFGGSSLVITMAGIGLLVSIARHGRDHAGDPRDATADAASGAARPPGARGSRD